MKTAICAMITSLFFAGGLAARLAGADTFEVLFEAARVDVPGGPGASGIASGDLNGDGKPDVVVGNQGGQISVFLGDGTPTYQLSGEFRGALNMISVALGDFDGDGSLDVAAAGPNGNAASKLNIFLGDGTGAFTSNSHLYGGQWRPMRGRGGLR